MSNAWLDSEQNWPIKRHFHHLAFFSVLQSSPAAFVVWTEEFVMKTPARVRRVIRELTADSVSLKALIHETTWRCIYSNSRTQNSIESLSFKKKIDNFVFRQLCVRVDAKMAAAASVPTDVPASTGLPGHNVNEVRHNPFKVSLISKLCCGTL